jgi:multiple sugar transport system permease protein
MTTSRLSMSGLTVVLSYVLLLAGVVLMIMPFMWMTSTACKPTVELNKVPVRWLPQNPVCGENLDLLYETSPRFNHYFFNSAIVTVGRTLGQLVTCSLAAYGFARFKFPGRGVLFALCLGLLMVPFQAILVPEYILMRDQADQFVPHAFIPGAFGAFAMFLLLNVSANSSWDRSRQSRRESTSVVARDAAAFDPALA